MMVNREVWVQALLAAGILLVLSWFSGKPIIFLFLTAAAVFSILVLFLIVLLVLHIYNRRRKQNSETVIVHPESIQSAVVLLSTLFMVFQFGLGMWIISGLGLGVMGDLLLIGWLVLSFIISIKIGWILTFLRLVGIGGIWAFWTKPVIIPYLKMLEKDNTTYRELLENDNMTRAHLWLREQDFQWRASLVFGKTLKESYFSFWIRNPSHRLQFKLVWF